MRYFEMKGIFRFLSGIMGITWLLWGGCRPTIKEHDQSLSDITVIDLEYSGGGRSFVISSPSGFFAEICFPGACYDCCGWVAR